MASHILLHLLAHEDHPGHLHLLVQSQSALSTSLPVVSGHWLSVDIAVQLLPWSRLLVPAAEPSPLNESGVLVQLSFSYIMILFENLHSSLLKISSELGDLFAQLVQLLS